VVGICGKIASIASGSFLHVFSVSIGACFGLVGVWSLEYKQSKVVGQAGGGIIEITPGDHIIAGVADSEACGQGFFFWRFITKKRYNLFFQAIN
jgi:hypothetical protein